MYTPRKKAVLIIRVSDPKQEREGLSLDNQEQVLRRYAHDNGFDIVKEFRFQESADLKIRKHFNEVIDFVKAREAVPAIIGYRVDRMTRNYHDHVKLDELRLHHGKELHFVYDHLVITPTTVGRDIQEWDTKVFMAKMYINRLKEDAVISGAFKISRGEWPGMAPFGYLNVKVNERSWIEPDPVNALIVVFCYENYATGAYSMKQIRELVKEEFGVSLSQGRVDFILKTRFYCGEMVYKGEIHPHVYEPLISRDLFERVMAVKASFHKKPHKFAGLPFMYRGMIRCADCGCMITPEIKRKKDGRTYTYYHCTQYHKKHGARWVSEQKLTEQFMEIFDGLRLPEDEIAGIIEGLKQSHDGKKVYANTERTHFRIERDKYLKRIEALYEDRLDSTITKEYYAQKRLDYEEKIRRIDSKLSDVDEADEEYYYIATAILELCQMASDVFVDASFEKKRMLLNLLLQNCELKEKTLLWKLKSPFDAVFYHVSRREWLPLTNAFRNKSLSLAVTFDELQVMLSRLAALGLSNGQANQAA